MRIRTLPSAAALAAAAAAVLLGGGASAPAAYPGSNGAVAFTSGQHIWITTSSGLKDLTAAGPAPAPESQPKFSPDGKRIAFTRGGQVWVMNSDGSGRRQLTSLTYGATDPTWSPDGGSLAYVASDAPYVTNITIARADGIGAPREITHDNSAKQDLAWSPRGDQIAYASRPASGGHKQIWTIRPDGSGAHALTNDNADDVEPAWSPDGTKIVFSGPIHPGESVGGDLWTMNADGTGLAPLHHQASYSDGAFPAWSPDGTTIAFAANNGSGYYHLWSVPAGGGTNTELVTNRVNGSNPVDQETDWQPLPHFAPPSIAGAAWNATAATTAQVVGAVRTTGAPATCSVVYETQALWAAHKAFDARAGATPPVPCGASGGEAVVKLVVGGLTPRTAYHFELRVASAGGAAGGGPQGSAVIQTPPSDAQFGATKVTPNALTRAFAGGLTAITRDAGHAALGAVSTAAAAGGKTAQASLADGSVPVGVVGRDSALTTSGKSVAIGAGAGGVISVSGGVVRTGAVSGHAAPVGRHGVIAVGPGNLIRDEKGHLRAVPGGQVGFVSAAGDVLAIGPGKLPASVGRGTQRTVGARRAVATRVHGLTPYGTASVTTLKNGVATGLEVWQANVLAAGTATQTLSISARDFARLVPSEARPSAPVKLLSGSARWTRPVARVLALRPTRAGRTFFKALARADAARKKAGRPALHVRLTVATRFVPRHGRPLISMQVVK